MKKWIALLLVLALAVSASACGGAAPAPTETTAAVETAPAVPAAPAVDDGNLLPANGLNAADPLWNIYMESGGDGEFSIGGGELKVSVKAPGRVAHAVQVYCDGFEILKGAKYLLTMDVKSSVERTFEWRVQVNGGDYHAYAGDETVQAGTEYTTLSYEFVMEEPSDPAPRFCFNLGDRDKSQGLESHEVTFRNLKLILLDDSNAESVVLETNAVDINVNQIGFHNDSAKVAVFRNAAEGTAFELVDTKSGEVVYTGTVSGSRSGGSSGETVTLGDFTEYTTPGIYLVRGADGTESYPFYIGEYVYDQLLADTVKMLYLQRCGTELSEALAGDFAHPVCHTEIAEVYGTGEQMEVSGGWHDAGDYGRYTVPGAKAAADLMLAFCAYPDAFGDNYDIPESGNGVADVLDEARYELEWLMKMQRGDGGVYHKVTGLNFDGTIMPQDCTEKLYVMPVSRTATGDFAAVMYMAARVFRGIDAAFADKCILQAEKALAWCEANPDAPGFTNPSDVLTGEYPDENSHDEYFWALCEGFKTTGDETLAGKIAAFDMSLITEDGLGWISMAEYAYFAYLTADKADAAVAEKLEAAFMAYADEAVRNAAADSYGSSIADDYPWGSNMTIANNGMLMLMASQMGKGDEYLAGAAAQLDYLLGVNTLSYCFVSGYGSVSPEHPHHRPSQALGQAMPGMLAGGPNSNLEDAYASQVLRGAPKAACYVDNDQSYSCNEITIYWNSPLVYLLAGLV